MPCPRLLRNAAAGEYTRRRGPGRLACRLGCAGVVLWSLMPPWVPDAAAGETQPDLYYAAATGIGIATVSADVVMWSAGYQTTGTWDHWAWHFVPVAGPVLGLRATDSQWSNCDNGKNQWCGFGKTITYVFEGVFLAAQVTAVALVGVGAYKSGQKESKATSSTSQSLILPQLTVSSQSCVLQWQGSW
jgi:hypothetical protein